MRAIMHQTAHVTFQFDGSNRSKRREQRSKREWGNGWSQTIGHRGAQRQRLSLGRPVRLTAYSFLQIFKERLAFGNSQISTWGGL
jgi:hypothetical protein